VANHRVSPRPASRYGQVGLVGVRGLEPLTSASQTPRATTCATPRNLMCRRPRGSAPNRRRSSIDDRRDERGSNPRPPVPQTGALSAELPSQRCGPWNRPRSYGL